MRNFQMKRQRGRNRGNNQGGGKQTQNANRAFDSNGPDGIKVRGHAQHVYEKYQQLARDASSAGDRVLAENYLQHAEHYFRTIRALQPNKPVTEIVGRETFASGFDIDFEDETVVAAIEATDAQALERDQNGGGQPAEATAETGDGVQQGQGGQGGQNRPWEPRPPRGDRFENRDRGDRFQGDRNNNREDRYGDRPREERQQNGDRPPREDRQGGDRPRYENRDREDRQGGQGGGDRPFNRDRDRDRGDRPFNRDRDREDRQGQAQGQSAEGGDRPRFERQERGDRPERGDRYERRDRGDRYERGDRSERVEPAADISSPLVAPATETGPEPAPARMLRSEDGGVSHAPAFLQGAAPAPTATEGDMDEAPKPRRRRKPKAEAAGEPSEG